MGLIQTPEQLQFAWTAIVDGLKSIAAGNIFTVTENIYFLGDYTTNGMLGEPCPINVEMRKRKSETHEEIDERTAKR